MEDLEGELHEATDNDKHKMEDLERELYEAADNDDQR